MQCLSIAGEQDICPNLVVNGVFSMAKRGRKVKDWTGKTVGALVVLKRVPDTNPIKWECSCRCGRILHKTSGELGNISKSGREGSCMECRRTQMKKIYVGAVFSKLVIVDARKGDNKALCRCECGKEKLISKKSLYSGNTKSCGCAQHTGVKGPKGKDWMGEKVGKLLVIAKVGKDKSNHTVWKCVCDCGNIVEVNSPYLTICANGLRKHQASCRECLRKELRGVKEGEVYGHLTVINPITENEMTLCRCDCGTLKEFRHNNILQGATTSCGCHQYDHLKEKRNKKS